MGLIAGLLAAISLVLCSLGFAQARRVISVPSPFTGRTVEAYDGRVILVPKPGVTARQMQAVFASWEAAAARPLVHGGVWIVDLPAGQSVREALGAYGAEPLVQFAEPDMLRYWTGVPKSPVRPARDRAMVIPNDTLWSSLWGMQKIDAPGAWDGQTGDPTVVCAVIDSGTDYTHPDLAGRMWVNPGEIPGDGIDNDANGYVDDVNGWDFFDNDNVPTHADAGGNPHPHGTHVAGTVGATANNALGVVGVTWTCPIMPLRVGGGSGPSTAAIYEAITYAADNGADVTNMSFGGPYNPADQVSIDYAYAAGVVQCASTGNSDWEFTLDPATWFSPVCNDGVVGVDNKIIGVAATDEDDVRAVFSNYGGAHKFVDVCAPGVGILSTVPGGGYESWDGTSMACPHVVGLAGLVVSEVGKDIPQTVIDQIRDTAANIDALNPLYAGKLGTGRIDASAAIGFDPAPASATAVMAFDTANDEGGSVTVTWRRSGDDGAGRNDVTGYELWRGTGSDPTTSPFVRVADQSDLPPRSSGYIDADPALVNDQSYYYFVRTFDASQSVDSSVSLPATPRDDSSPPAIDNLVAQDTQADNGRSITLSWVGYTGSADTTKFRVFRSLAEFTSVTEDGVDPVAEIDNPSARSFVDKAQDPDADPTDPDAQPLDETDYWYAVTVVDDVGNSIQTVTPTGPAQCAPNLSISFSYGLRLITLPAVPIDPDPSAVFGFTDPTAESLARYDPTTQAYHTLATAPDDPFLRIAPGRAFWLNRSVPSFIGVGGRLLQDDETVVPLGQGWNQVGCPYDADYPFGGIVVRDQLGTDTPITASNLVRKYGWRYDGFARSYRLLSPILPNADQELPQREGMWIYATAPGLSLVFQNTLPPAAEAAAAVARLDGWQLQLIASTAEAADVDNYLGATRQAEAIGPILSPPPIGAGVDLYFTGDGGERLAADLRPAVGPKAKWGLVVECGAADTDVELTWPDLSGVPADVRPILKDLETGRTVYMRTAGSYTFRSGAAGEKRDLEVSCAAPGAQLVLQQVAATPVKAGGIEVVFALPRAADVTVEIRNVAGRAVATVPAPQSSAGLNRVLWNGLSAGGQALPNGTYLVALKAVAQDNGETAQAVRAIRLER